MIVIFAFCGYIYIESNYNFNNTMESFKNLQKNIVIVAVLTILSVFYSIYIINGLFYKYRHHSNIAAYRQNIKIPEDI
jgi:hypothetical protein